MTSCGIEFVDFLQPTITTFDMAVPSVLAGVQYLCQIVKLLPLKEMLQGDLILGGDSAHPANHSSGHYVAGDASLIRLGPRFHLPGAWHS